MQVFNVIFWRRLSVAMGFLMLGGWAFEAVAQAHHKGAEKPPELGTGVALDANGHFWIVSKEGAGPAQFLVLQESADGGRTWSVPKRIMQQPEAIAADGENRPKLAFGAKGELYVTYTRPLARPYTGEIRFLRSVDGGQSFSAPITVHANRDVITHRFESMIVDPHGRIYVAWIDKRDVEAAAAHKQKYAGAAVYYAVSQDSGASFQGDYKAAGHSCECCRIALAQDPEGRIMALWRHVFESNVRDHALAELTPAGGVAAPLRATFDNWRIDACPHQGPALAYAGDGTRHQVWFSVKGDEGGVFYASAARGGKLSTPIKVGSDQAGHADVAVDGKNIVLAWKQFDGKSTAILGRWSADGGLTWRERELARTGKASDQPHLLNTRSGIVLVWRTQDDGVRIVAARPED